jgi:hypothetical protein
MKHVDWTVSYEDSCTRCTNWVIGVDFWNVYLRANTHVSSSVTDVVDILDVNYDDLFCDYNTFTTVNSVTNTRTIQQAPMFHDCTITNLNITINKWKCVKVSAFSLFNDVKYLSRDNLCTEVSHKGNSYSIFLYQHNFICSKFKW